MMPHTKYQDSMPGGFGQVKNFMLALYKSICKTYDPFRRHHFWPQCYNLNKLGRGSTDDAT